MAPGNLTASEPTVADLAKYLQFTELERSSPSSQEPVTARALNQMNLSH